jgi:hypothetical protein
MDASQLMSSPLIRQIPDRYYESEEERSAALKLNRLQGWSYSEYAGCSSDVCDLTPSLAGNWHCRNDMDLRAGILHLMAVSLRRHFDLEDVINDLRARRHAVGRGDDRCTCGRAHWLDRDQHDVAAQLGRAALHALDLLGVHSFVSPDGGHGWRVGLAPELGLPPRVVGQWDQSIRFFSTRLQMIHICVTRAELCPPSDITSAPFRIPLDVALGISSVAARHDGQESTVGLVHIDADRGSAKAFLAYTPVAETGRVCEQLAEYWREHQQMRIGTAA